MKPFCAWSCWTPGLKWEVAAVVEPGAMCHPSSYSSPHCLKHSQSSACSSIPLTACPSSSSSPDPAHTFSPHLPNLFPSMALTCCCHECRHEGEDSKKGRGGLPQPSPPHTPPSFTLGPSVLVLHGVHSQVCDHLHGTVT